MTVSTTQNRVSYAGNGVTTAFSFPYVFFDNADLVVLLANADGTFTTAVLGTDYTVTGAGVDAGGTVTMTTAPASGITLVVYRDPQMTQPQAFVDNDPLPAKSISRGYDRLTLVSQRIRELVNRSFRLSDADTTGASPVLPTPTPNAFIGWNGLGNGLVNRTITDLITVSAYGTAIADKFTGDGAKKDFTLSANPGALANLDVSIGGVTQQAGRDFTWDGATKLSFVTAPPAPSVAGDTNVYARYLRALPQGYSDGSIVNWNDNAGVARDVQSTLQRLTGETISVKDPRFGAKGDGATDDTAAIQSAIAAVVAAGGGEVFLPRGTYKITAPLTLNTGVYGNGVSLRGAGRNTVINQVGVGQDAVKFSTTQFLQNSYLRDLQIVCAATAGHCINIVYGCTTCAFDNLELVQNNPAKACVYADYTSFGGGIYDTKFRGGSWYCANGATEAGVRVKANGTIFNENVFENLRCYNANAKQFFYIETVTTGSIWLANNNLRSINFEVCKGGGIRCDSAKNWKLENISFWDAGGAYTGHLIDFGTGVGYEASANTLANVGRNGDTLTAGVRDIRILSGQDTVIINSFTQSADAPSYDFNSKRVTVIGRLYNVLNGGNVATILPDVTSIPVIFGGDVYGDTVHLGGRSLAEGATLAYSAGYVQFNTLPNSSGFALAGKDGSGNVKKILWDTAEFYPLSDNTASCGIASGRWTQVYAATATISTSDQDAKANIAPIDDAVLRAWSKVAFCQYQFKDAIEHKGDGARWHFGVIAQQVKAAFESEGLDAFRYGLLCLDQWDATDEVVNDAGEVVIPARAAGQRYGVRYEEALALECAYLRSRLAQ